MTRTDLIGNDFGKVIMILGDFLHEGIITKINTLGFNYVQETLYDRLPKTWRQRIAKVKSLRGQNILSGVILYLPTPLFLYGCKDEYSLVWDELLTELGNVKSIAFAFEDNLTGSFNYWDYKSKQSLNLKQLQKKYDELLKSPNYFDSYESIEFREAQRVIFAMENIKEAEEKSNEMSEFITKLYDSHVEVVPFKKRSDVTVRIQEFLEEIDSGVFLRLYVPKGRYQSEQLDRFLKLFEEYLVQVEKHKFSIDSKKTENGTTYVFKGEKGISSDEEFDILLDKFDNFMKVCQNDPTKAESILKNIGISPTDTSFIISKYVKNYRRLVMDARHEFERKKLILSQTLENEIFEQTANSISIIQPSSPNPSLMTMIGNSGPITINIEHLSLKNRSKVQSQIGQIFNGDIEYTSNDLKLLELFERYAEHLHSIELKSALELLKDDSMSEEIKKTAKQRILSFLIKTAKKIGDRAIDFSIKALVTYLEKLATGTNV